MPTAGRPSQLGPLEKKIMGIRWRRPDATVRWVVDRLQKRGDAAYTSAHVAGSLLIRWSRVPA